MITSNTECPEHARPVYLSACSDSGGENTNEDIVIIKLPITTY